MKDIFVFTATGKDAQEHWRNSIANPVDPAVVYENFPDELSGALQDIENQVGSFYCWGAIPGKPPRFKNVGTWERMQIGSPVLGYHTKHYRCVTSVVQKFHNREFAKALWSEDGDGATWEYMYFLNEPIGVDVPVDNLSDILGGGPRGFYKVGGEKMAHLSRTFSSFDAFVEERLMSATGVDLSDLIDGETSQHPDPAIPVTAPREPTVEERLEELAKLTKGDSEFNPESLEDARERTMRSIVYRRGQPDFRRKLLLAYGERCAVTQFDCPASLEAAHITPYLGEATNEITNGLLLRSDIHSLFDCGLIAVESNSMTVILADSLKRSMYKYLDGKPLYLPGDRACSPNRQALNQHREKFGL